jgi:hypothetical protein
MGCGRRAETRLGVTRVLLENPGDYESRHCAWYDSTSHASWGRWNVHVFGDHRRNDDRRLLWDDGHR